MPVGGRPRRAEGPCGGLWGRSLEPGSRLQQSPSHPRSQALPASGLGRSPSRPGRCCSRRLGCLCAPARGCTVLPAGTQKWQGAGPGQPGVPLPCPGRPQAGPQAPSSPRRQQGVPPSPPLCPPRRQGRCPPPRSTPRTPERMSSPRPQPPQPLNQRQRMPRRGPVTATPSLGLHRPLPPPQTRPKTPGPRGRTGLRPPPARPPCAQVSLCPPPSGQAQRGHSGPGPHGRPVAAQRCGRLLSSDPRVPSPPPARRVPPPTEAQQSAGSRPQIHMPSQWSAPPETSHGLGDAGRAGGSPSSFHTQVPLGSATHGGQGSPADQDVRTRLRLSLPAPEPASQPAPHTWAGTWRQQSARKPPPLTEQLRGSLPRPLGQLCEDGCAQPGRDSSARGLGPLRKGPEQTPPGPRHGSATCSCPWPQGAHHPACPARPSRVAPGAPGVVTASDTCGLGPGTQKQPGNQSERQGRPVVQGLEPRAGRAAAGNPRSWGRGGRGRNVQRRRTGGPSRGPGGTLPASSLSERCSLAGGPT